ncbi:carboxymuconolactone decarboxylase family protein [Pacificimonas sp. WHA3]|uniref:Alkyl hydroperoxide reductase AhpD n=1 Tax=Pacificimonas pallii TaxID=2827236 RepID=A0ABS6SEU7_9SPHN|nr:carboxymuconolactone decarboxylase family protein [Pacificimonas pallii]MBV7256800.1 carboxymuconolactone decarboxylase family protein [Pacificimonas pallii]
MSVKDLARTLPDYAKDTKLNISSLLDDQMVDDQKKYGLLVACAHATGYGPLIDAAEEEAAEKLSAEALTAAKGAASVMAMNNIYYRFTHLVSNGEYGQMPAKLRMSIIGKPGVDKADFELWALAVSAINGCGMCVDSHEKVLRGEGVNADVIQYAARMAAVTFALGRSLAAA